MKMGSRPFREAEETTNKKRHKGGQVQGLAKKTEEFGFTATLEL